MEKTYRALVCGHVKKDSGTIALPIGRSLKDRKKMAVTNVRSREALTEYRLLDRFRLYDLLEINLKTGRTHQIRVHFSHFGHPILGDPEYGGRMKWHRGILALDKKLAFEVLKLIERQALHATGLKFIHPITGNEIVVNSEPAGDFKKLLEFLEVEGR